MSTYQDIRELICSDLDTLKTTNNPRSIFEISEDYWLANQHLDKNVIEDILKEEAEVRGLVIH
jgi:hypothetical protein